MKFSPHTGQHDQNSRKRGYTFSEPDLIIAATALHHGLTIVSRDVSEYEQANVPVLNPWESPASSSD